MISDADVAAFRDRGLLRLPAAADPAGLAAARGAVFDILSRVGLWTEGEGWTLIDCGIASDETRALWTRLFESGLDGLPIRRLLCTHTHPDHVGSAHWLQQRFGAPLCHRRYIQRCAR